MKSGNSEISCPKCKSKSYTKSGVVKDRQRYKCKDCNYYFSVAKEGKNIDSYYIIKALQLYIEGVTYREIERILGISHVSVMNWVKKFGINRPENLDYKPTYNVMSHDELIEMIKDEKDLKSSGILITPLGDKYMVIKWDRFKQ